MTNNSIKQAFTRFWQHTVAAIKKVSTIAVSESQPRDENVKLWINPEADETINVPEIKDNEISAVDTWSSQKINSFFADGIIIDEVVKLSYDENKDALKLTFLDK